MYETSSKTAKTASERKNIGAAKQPIKLYIKIIIVEVLRSTFSA